MNYPKYLKTVEYLNQLSVEYYENNRSLVPDSVYDSLYREVVDFEEKHPNLIDAKTPTRRVGSGSSSAG